MYTNELDVLQLSNDELYYNSPGDDGHVTNNTTTSVDFRINSL